MASIAWETVRSLTRDFLQIASDLPKPLRLSTAAAPSPILPPQNFLGKTGPLHRQAGHPVIGCCKGSDPNGSNPPDQADHWRPHRPAHQRPSDPAFHGLGRLEVAW